MSYLLVYSTTSSVREARQLAGILLRKRLAACINISPSLESHYWWQGKKEKAKEVLLVIKTEARLFGKLAKTIEKHHSYSVPEIIATPIRKGNRKYLAWLSKEVCR